MYSVLSEFTLALLEDSGWYQVNYAMANRTVNDEPIPLLYGRGRSDGGMCVDVWVYEWMWNPMWLSFNLVLYWLCSRVE